jgi:3-phosphoshikimate 1-carboxyvinyltransferase
MTPLLSRPGQALTGTIRVPGDKSISHRALLLGASAVGTTVVRGLLEGEDVLNTARALERCGIAITRAEGVWRIDGRGTGGLVEPDGVLDMGNSGTGARLLMGLLATQPFPAFFAGDASLSRRPMGRVIEPLERMGAQFWTRSGRRLPLLLRGARDPMPIEYTLPVASAQVKSAILLAGLNAPGETTVIEPEPTRDHSERLLAHFGADVGTEELPDGGRRVTIRGYPELAGREVLVPGDISSAAFPLIAALIVPGSRVTARGVGVNPLRTGLLETLAEMGARIDRTDLRSEGGEAVADLTASPSSLTGVRVPATRVPSMIDEFPVLAVAAAFARGTTRMEGLAELRVKESDRLTAIAAGLEATGVAVTMGDDWLEVHGTGRPPPGGCRIATHFDHRIAMAFLVLGAAARAAVSVDDGDPIGTSFPDFVPLMNGLGAAIGGERSQN